MNDNTIERMAFALYVAQGYTHAIGTAEDSWAKDREAVREQFRGWARACAAAIPASETQAWLYRHSSWPSNHWTLHQERPAIEAFYSGQSEVREIFIAETLLTPADFDVEGSRWIPVERMGSAYEEELDVSRENGHHRHRLRAVGPDDPHRPWQKGPAPE